MCGYVYQQWYEVQEIENALVKAFSKEFRAQLLGMDNPYEKAGTSELIVQKIKDMLSREQSMKKHFYDVEFEE